MFCYEEEVQVEAGRVGPFGYRSNYLIDWFVTGFSPRTETHIKNNIYTLPCPACHNCFAHCCVSRSPFFYVLTHSHPQRPCVLASTKNCHLWEGPIFWACAENLFCILSQSDSWAWAEWREFCELSGVEPSQRSQYLVLTKRSAAPGDKNGPCQEPVHMLKWNLKFENSVLLCHCSITWLLTLRDDWLKYVIMNTI